jgi:hypothetical protein
MTTIIKEQNIMMTEIAKLISEGRTVTITAKGYSMNPFIVHMEDQITLGPWKDEDIRRGAVTLVKDVRGNYLIHRIIKRKGNRILLMGDGNLGIRENAFTENIIGLMTSVTKKGRSYPVTGPVWRLYSFIWTLLRHVRRYPLALWRRMHPQQPLR